MASMPDWTYQSRPKRSGRWVDGPAGWIRLAGGHHRWWNLAQPGSILTGGLVSPSPEIGNRIGPSSVAQKSTLFRVVDTNQIPAIIVL